RDGISRSPTWRSVCDCECGCGSIDELERRAPARLALIHFGIVEEARLHLEALRARLHSWTSRVRQGATEEEFIREAADERATTSRHADIGELAMPLWQSYAGIWRYVVTAAEAS